MMISPLGIAYCVEDDAPRGFQNLRTCSPARIGPVGRADPAGFRNEARFLARAGRRPE
jgi:hypothetical protein